MIETNLGAGGNIGIIRNPTGDWDEPLKQPRIVAATRPIMLGFPDGSAYNELTGTVMVAMQSQNQQFVYDVGAMIHRIEIEAAKPPRKPLFGNAIPDQFPEDLTGLLRGVLSTIPIDVIEPTSMVAADYGFKASTTQAGNVSYGVPEQGPFGETPNAFAPIPAGRLPRGPSSQNRIEPVDLVLVNTPYNQATNLLSFPASPLHVEAGVQAMVEVHSGTLHETHELVSYHSQGMNRQIVLHYDSGRAEPRFSYHVGVAGLADQPRSEDTRLVVGVNARRGEFATRSIGYEEPTDRERVAGFLGGENFYSVADLDDNAAFGASLLMDMTEAPTGLYENDIRFGLFDPTADEYVRGHFFEETEYMPFVNLKNGPFGAGGESKDIFNSIRVPSEFFWSTGTVMSKSFLLQPSRISRIRLCRMISLR